VLSLTENTNWSSGPKGLGLKEERKSKEVGKRLSRRRGPVNGVLENTTNRWINRPVGQVTEQKRAGDTQYKDHVPRFQQGETEKTHKQKVLTGGKLGNTT